jgi:hypothetical protein
MEMATSNVKNIQKANSVSCAGDKRGSSKKGKAVECFRCGGTQTTVSSMSLSATIATKRDI